MQKYIGTKLVLAAPMTRGDYNHYRGWTIPANEDPEDVGYLVEYLDGGEPNHEDHEGYISWSPANVFERSYHPTKDLAFGAVVAGLKCGYRFTRSGWNGKDMFIFLVNGSHFKVNRPPLLGIYPEGHGIDYRAHIDMKTADGSVVPWVASQTDLLAEDWKII